MWWRKRIALFTMAQSQLRGNLSSVSHRIRYKCAEYLHRQDAKLTIRQRKICFAVFLLAGCGASALIVVDTFYGEKRPDAMIISPAPVVPFRKQEPVPRFSRNDTINVHAFRQVLDSLQATDEGRRMLREQFRSRPGLIDSFRILENMFR